jgi:hypothetical protein
MLNLFVLLAQEAAMYSNLCLLILVPAVCLAVSRYSVK